MSKGVGYYMLFAKTHDINNVKARALKKQMLKMQMIKERQLKKNLAFIFLKFSI